MKILLVDDEEIVHQTLGDYLRDSGCQVEDAYDGLYALQIIQKLGIVWIRCLRILRQIGHNEKYGCHAI